MFIETVPNRSSRPTILVRHSYRWGGKVKKRTLANITKLPPEMIEKLRAVLRGAILAAATGGIEQALAERHLSEGSPILYDLASVWSYSRT